MGYKRSSNLWLMFQRLESKKHSKTDAFKGVKEKISYKEGT